MGGALGGTAGETRDVRLASGIVRQVKPRLLSTQARLGQSPGDEEEPFVPSVSTRARPGFLWEHHTLRNLVLDWHFAYDPRRSQDRLLDDPFAQHYGPWQNRERLGTS